MKRILIQNGTLYDGLGGQPYQADLLVQDGRIAQIAPGITEPQTRSSTPPARR